MNNSIVQKNGKPCLVVADPSLVDVRGHHYPLSLQITHGAQSQGIEVIWLTHRDFVRPDALEHVRTYPVFTATMYDRYRRDRVSVLPNDLDGRLLNELKSGIGEAGIGETDHVFFHTGFGDVYRAVARYVSIPDWRRNPYLHVCTPYDLNTMPGKEPGSPLPSIFRSMRTLAAVDRKAFFWAETPQLASHLTASYGFNVRALPLPPPEFLRAYSPAKDDGVVTALYLGAAREEKGFLHLPEIAQRLYETHGLSGKLRFVIQCTPQIIGYLPSITSAIQKLAAYPAGYVRLVDTVLSEREYQSLLLASDVVLLFYNEKNYRIRGSGIAVEAVCADKCILTQKNTFCASLITQGGGAAVEGIEEAVQFLIDLVANRNEYRKRGRLQGRGYREERSAEKYIRKIVNQTEAYHAVPFFPSSIIGHISPTLLRGY